MPRTLPWLTGRGDGNTDRRAIKPQPDSDSDRDKTPKATKSKKDDADSVQDILRSCKQDHFPLTRQFGINLFIPASPPTQPLRRCPSEEYLIEGFENDDIYMMVEDEFYAVAQTFTQHLHYAEYIRRTKEAKSQNAARIQDIARATDGITPMSEETKKRKEADALAERQKVRLGELDDGDKEGTQADNVEDDDGEDVFQDDSWAGTSLYDLMISPRRSRSLVGAQTIKSSTRAAAGYAQALQSQNSGIGAVAGLPPPSPLGGREQGRQQVAADETASEDDDLDVQPMTTFKRTAYDIKTPKIENETKPPKTEKPEKSIEPKKPISHTASKSIKPEPAPAPAPETKPKPEPKQTPSISARTQKPPMSNTPKRRILFDDFDELPEPKSKVSSVLEQKQKQKTDSPASLGKSPNGSRGGDSNNLESKQSRLNEVPTFLL